MAFQVVDPEHRLVQRQRQAAGHRGADQQRTGQARSLRVGDRIDGIRLQTGFGKHLLQQRNGAPDVIARGQFRHHAAIRLVHGDLGMQRMRPQTELRVVQRNAGFVARGFDA